MNEQTMCRGAGGDTLTLMENLSQKRVLRPGTPGSVGSLFQSDVGGVTGRRKKNMKNDQGKQSPQFKKKVKVNELIVFLLS